MFGGRSSKNLADVWQYFEGEWKDISPMAGPQPSARRGFAAAFHPDLGLVVFGGDDGTTSTHYPPGTWVLDGVWTLLDGVEPGPRAFATMEYFPPSNSLILVGGHDINGTANRETWALDDDGQWAPLASALLPVRAFHTMAFDPIGERLLLHGGCQSPPTCNSTALDDTWEWKNEEWNLLLTGETTTDYGGVMTKGTADQTIFRFTRSNEVITTHRWSDERWLSVDTDKPPIGDKFQAAYYDPDNSVIAFGGNDGKSYQGDTWRFHCQ